MKAAVYTNYGPPEVVHVKDDVPKPTPKPNEVLIRVHATTVASGDSRVRSLNLPPGFGPFGRLMFGILRPRNHILGTDLAGEIVSVGSAVTKFKPGDKVVAMSGMSFGSHAEYNKMPENGAMALMPPNLSFQDAAAILFGGTTALSYLKNKAKILPGESVLIIGASGAVGSAAVQLAKNHFGATVTGVCSTSNVDLVKSLGADAVIDYKTEDFTKNGKVYDVIMDTIGVASFSECKNSLNNKSGRLLLVAAGLPQMLSIPWRSLTSSIKVIAGPSDENAETVQAVADLAEAGKFKPVVSQTFPLGRIVEAHTVVDSGRKVGNIVILIE